MITLTKQQILDLIASSGASRPVEIAEHLGISPQATHRHLKSLVADGRLRKIGHPPKVFYQISSKRTSSINLDLTEEEADFLYQYFSYLTPTGEVLRGQKAFQFWLEGIGQAKSSKPLFVAYRKRIIELENLKNKDGFFDLGLKLQDTFSDVSMDKVLCSDFYSLPQFGKTYLGNLVTAGKSGQSKSSIKEIASIIKADLLKIIAKYEIDSLAWIPHSVSRSLMFLVELEKMLDFDLPKIEIVKAYSGDVMVAQKSLSKLKDRIENARETFVVVSSDKKRPENVLLIDDALGSGSTLNEVARKIQTKYKPNSIIAYAIVGSLKGFDVLNVV